MDFSWSEMLLVGVVALIVIGPKDLPGMFRELGRITAKLRTMGREFSRAMEQAAKESGVKEATDGLKTLTNPAGAGLDAVKSAADRFEKWDPLKPKPTTPPAAAAAAAPAAAAASAPVAEAVAPKVETTPTMGPATAELARKQAARKAVVAEAAAKLRAVEAGVAEPVVAEVAAAPKKPGRVRKKADKPAGEAT
ncbi:Sec-independent protein translocase protein TatB [Tabrizicola sp. BL-A-41-H6]|uniref:Sec-independent protein translocase protein TatB n=1 Tax=Tabrizicola sp. BL-A-41-H6 TaxID=3421107 RepID=UPI003D67F7F1